MKCICCVGNNLYLLYGVNEEDYPALGIGNRITILNERSTCYLDPGGMAYMKAPVHTILIQDASFEVMVDKAYSMAEIVQNASVIGSYVIFQSFRHRVIMPSRLKDNLVAALREIGMSDAALNTQMDKEAALEQIYANGAMLRPNRTNKCG